MKSNLSMKQPWIFHSHILKRYPLQDFRLFQIADIYAPSALNARRFPEVKFDFETALSFFSHIIKRYWHEEFHLFQIADIYASSALNDRRFHEVKLEHETALSFPFSHS